jgi:hypothetical protein
MELAWSEINGRVTHQSRNDEVVIQPHEHVHKISGRQPCSDSSKRETCESDRQVGKAPAARVGNTLINGISREQRQEIHGEGMTIRK